MIQYALQGLLGFILQNDPCYSLPSSQYLLKFEYTTKAWETKTLMEIFILELQWVSPLSVQINTLTSKFLHFHSEATTVSSYYAWTIRNKQKWNRKKFVKEDICSVNKCMKLFSTILNINNVNQYREKAFKVKLLAKF